MEGMDMRSIDDLDDLKNSEWISWIDLSLRWRVRDFELIKFLQKEGLQPYSENGLSLNCPITCHAHRTLSDEYHRVVNQLMIWEKRSSTDAVLENILPGQGVITKTSKGRMKRMRELEKQKKEILAKMKTIEEADGGLTSWKFFETPSLDVDLEEVLQELRKTLFKKEDVTALELKFNLGSQEQSHSERVREEVRALGKKLLKEDPATTKAHVIREAKKLGIMIKRLSQSGEEENYSPKTLRNMLKDLPFDSSPGVRKTAKK